MLLVDKENVKGYVQMDEKEHTKKEYASKGLAGTALGLGIGGLAVSLLNNGCNPLGIFGRNCGTNAGEVAIAANEQYLERKQCADFVELVNGMWQKAYDAQKARQDDRNVLNAELFSIYSAMRNGFDAINAKHNEDAFNLYKYSRDSKDELSSEIGELQLMIQEELINSVKDKVAASPQGKELLEKQLNNIKVKKEEIIKEANKNIEIFKRFQEAARLNPNLTYAEFIKTLN